MNIVLIGSGNVATHLGVALKAAEHSILQVWSRKLQHAQALAQRVGAVGIDDQGKLSQNADVYLICVLDDAIETIAPALLRFSGIVAHTSGSTPMNVFGKSLSRVGVLYPLQTFSKEVPLDLSETPFLVEASGRETRDILMGLAASLSSNVQYCTSQQRLNLHIAAVFACNFSNHLYAVAQRILENNELDFSLLRPLIIQTAQKAISYLPSQIQTGPAARGDEKIIQKHLAELERLPELRKLYELLSADIQQQNQ